MDKTKTKVHLSSKVELKANENWSFNSPHKLRHGLSGAKETKSIEEIQLSLVNQNKSTNILELSQSKKFDAARNSGQREFAKKNSKKSHYITKK